MTALKINRFGLSEIENVTVRCKRCGAGHIIKMDSDQFGAVKCPSCGAPYGELAQQAFEGLRTACGAQSLGREHFGLEFDIVEEE
jgi:Zn finger protein HypA/HybF involved in hydrogenase expression